MGAVVPVSSGSDKLLRHTFKHSAAHIFILRLADMNIHGCQRNDWLNNTTADVFTPKRRLLLPNIYCTNFRSSGLNYHLIAATCSIYVAKFDIDHKYQFSMGYDELYLVCITDI